MTTNDRCKSILQQPCPYTQPPFMYVNGHAFCPCFMQALQQAYIGGYSDGKNDVEPEVGVIETKDENSAQGKA